MEPRWSGKQWPVSCMYVFATVPDALLKVMPWHCVGYMKESGLHKNGRRRQLLASPFFDGDKEGMIPQSVNGF